MPRPILDERMTLRLPKELLADVFEAASRRDCSANMVVITALEHDLTRCLTYRLDYYRDLRPLAGMEKGVNDAVCQTVTHQSVR